jgi:hypothetical protein
MKKLVSLILVLSALQSNAQLEPAFRPKMTLKWAPTGLILGSLSLQGEYNFGGGKNSLTVKLGLPVNSRHQLEYEGKDADFDMKATSFLAGYRMYLSKKHMRGLYAEPFFKYVHHASEGQGTGILNGRDVIMNFTNDYDGLGVGVQLGAQFRIKERFVIDLFFLGPEINSAKNNFRAVEASNTIPWTSVEAEDAENDIRDFIDNFPFIGDRTDIMVDKDNKTVTADFKGALPGVRVGISFGVAL